MTEDPWELPEDTIGGRLQRYDALKAKAERQEAALRELSNEIELAIESGVPTPTTYRRILARAALSTGEPSEPPLGGIPVKYIGEPSE